MRAVENTPWQSHRLHLSLTEGIDVPVTNVDPEWAAVWIDLMDQLPDELDREIVIGLRQGLTIKEIAATLGMKPTHV
jgi:hypothetical protein